MKTLILTLTAVALAACDKPVAEHHDDHDHAEIPAGNGAQFKTGVGVTLSDTMKKALAFQVAEVGEAKVAPSFTVALHVMAGTGGLQPVALPSSANEASGWLTAGQAALVQPGMEVELRAADLSPVRGTVKRLEKAPYPTLGDFEVTVETAAALEMGGRLVATFHAPAGEAVTAIPRSALLKTAEGTFVYAVNGAYYVRTPVKVGVVSDDHVEITDGLYAGDQIVTTPVMSLWLAELQVLRGGKACTCGH